MAEDTVKRPLCECHGLPMHRNGADEWGPKWRCAIVNTLRAAHDYDTMTGMRYARKLLLGRRRKALGRMAERKERSSGAIQTEG